ncbi:hypothetical protein RND71_027867 [Anisodus tanguticus]|uniref:Uncharacterized protein n=1 Tax=Anisodus tanguticus TaxID=243964 RepID=A0AAE1RHE2_9SOLA|nr:hypothetical protein RND71_027867 [Anisodus tanguticus]
MIPLYYMNPVRKGARNNFELLDQVELVQFVGVDKRIFRRAICTFALQTTA